MYYVKIKAFSDDGSSDVPYRDVASEVTREEAERIVNSIAERNAHHEAVNNWLDEMNRQGRTLASHGPKAITRGEVTQLLRTLGLRTTERTG